ncbi:Transcriptional activator protein LasR [Pandoraea aquatica]|uniref:Transcriptional activator protein LasR n=1 Tax=Pandoraea aquatica TaxID=2508290 RepID=A0A5E4TVV9_9BURK|nr:autoinducer binding domain-containing protein [Pandoraea aquatica]VVD92020.1 Transcriptional activator protein LasR [Pandoraea aquatica]
MRATRHLSPHSFADGLSALQNASDFDVLQALLPSLCSALGQRYFSYRGHFALPDGRFATPRLGNLPRVWQQRYDAQRYDNVDPVLSLAARQLTPVEWTAGLYASPEARQLLDEQRAAGLRFGITYPVFTPSGASGTLSLSSSRRPAHCLRPSTPHQSRPHTLAARYNARPTHDADGPDTHVWASHAAVVLAAHVHEAVWRIVQRDAAQRCAPALTPRERECLRWVACGKTSWEIGRILTLSEHGVVFHLRSAMRKFEVSSRHRAAKMASDYGLLDDVAGPPHQEIKEITFATQDRQASCSVST